MNIALSVFALHEFVMLTAAISIRNRLRFFIAYHLFINLSWVAWFSYSVFEVKFHFLCFGKLFY